MRTLIWFIVAILIIGWLLGDFAFGAGSTIHVLLIFAIILIIWNVFTGRGPL